MQPIVCLDCKGKRTGQRLLLLNLECIEEEYCVKMSCMGFDLNQLSGIKNAT